MKPIDFWYSIGSTYTYLTVMRLSDYAKVNGVTFNWCPFDVRAIMIEQKNIPFTNKPVKSSYMWRDIERRANKYGLPVSLPAPYPLDELVFANQVALLGQREGWGQDPERIIKEAQSVEIANALSSQTALCRDVGVFGAPTFVVDEEVFWGDDRLEDAVSWRKHGRVVA